MNLYIASKVKHAARWQQLRSDLADYNIHVISTWIDEAEVGQSIDFTDLWARCISEASACDVLLVYMEPGEALKGGWSEVGAALACGKVVYAVGCEGFSIMHHRNVVQFESLEGAIQWLKTK